MKWNKYVGETEQEAYLKVKEDLGDKALIISVSRVKPKGVAKLFKKPYVEVVATDDERFLKPRDKKKYRAENIATPAISIEVPPDEKSEKDARKRRASNDDYLLRQTAANSKYDNAKTGRISEEKIEDSRVIVENMQRNFKEESDLSVPDMQVEEKTSLSLESLSSNIFIQAIYEQLSESGVLEKNINLLTEGAHDLGDEDKKEIVAIVYKRIVDILSDYESIKKKEGNVVFFVGPTGVGKTTTIAKIASYFILNQDLKVALITADTYRIAAVEQLKTYANILNIPVKVIYNESELKGAIEGFKDFDLVFVDTAGRSHNDEEKQLELSKLLNAVDKKDVFLLLSAATKFTDIVSITEKYSDICDYKIIFTKLDETMTYGNILNTKLLTKAKLSYVTFGQSVPEDIGMIKPSEIAKSILGGAK